MTSIPIGTRVRVVKDRRPYVRGRTGTVSTCPDGRTDADIVVDLDTSWGGPDPDWHLYAGQVERLVDDAAAVALPIRARYDGKCTACGKTIIAGDEIIPQITEVREGFGELIREDITSWEHAVCPDARPVGTCPTCFLQQPCPCGDGQ